MHLEVVWLCYLYNPHKNSIKLVKFHVKVTEINN